MKSSLRGIKLFYEASTYSLPYVERKCIERSLTNGLQGLITRSSPDLTEYIELVQDICGFQEESTNPLAVGHIISQAKIGDLSSDFKLITEGFKFSTDHTYLLNHLAIQPDSTQLKDLSFLKEKFQETSTFLSSTSKVSSASLALDVSGRYLMELNDSGLSKLSDNILELSHKYDKFSVLHLPVNHLTYGSTLKIKQQLDHAGSSLALINTETLRTDLKIPGQVSVDYSYHSAHIVDELDISLKGHEAELQAMSPELASRLRACLYSSNDLKHVLDSALQVEKILLTKLADSVRDLGIPLPSICLAHAMVNNLSNIHSSEQLDFMLVNNIEPELEKALDKARVGGKDLSDWVTIYKPVSKRIIQSIRHSYHVKGLFDAQRLTEKLSRHTQEEVKFDQMPLALAHLSLNSFRTDAVCLSLMNVSPSDFSASQFSLRTNNTIAEVYADVAQLELNK